MTQQYPQYSSEEYYSSHYRDGHYRKHDLCSEDFAPPARQARVAPRSRHPQRPTSQRPAHQRSASQGFASQQQTVPQRTVQSQRPAVPQRRRKRSNAWIAGGGVLLAALAGIGPMTVLNSSNEGANAPVVCQEKIQSQSVLSRAELSKLLSISERAPKADVRAIIDEPYCTLPSVSVREGAISEREAYPLEFNPQTWFIVLYEEGEYAGFDFSFQRED